MHAAKHNYKLLKGVISWAVLVEKNTALPGVLGPFGMEDHKCKKIISFDCTMKKITNTL